MSTCNERMIQLLAHLKMNANELAVSLGYKRTDRIYNVINGRNGISPALARDICTLYPFNYAWIMTGEGEMLKQEVKPVIPTFLIEKVDRFKKAYQHLRGLGLAHTQKDIAEKMNTASSNISNAFNGVERYLTPSFLRRFNIAYGGIFNDEWLIDGIGEMLKQEVNSVVVGDDGKVRINIKPSATGRFRERRKMVERIKMLAPEFKEEGNGAISIVLKSLVEQNPTKALWVMTGNDNNVVVSRTDLEALKGQMKAFKMLYEIESKKNEELEAKIAAKAELI